MKLYPPGVNFTNILRAAFTLADPKSAKRQVMLRSFFALLGSASIKAAHKHDDEIDPRSFVVRDIQINQS